MPERAPRPCPVARCAGFRPCALHPERPQQASAASRGYGSAWRRESAAFLAQRPVCVDCGGPATVVDHVQPHKGDPVKFWDRGNWAPMCRRDHSCKTVKLDGGYGNPVRQAS